MNSTPIIDMKMETIMQGISMLPQCELMIVDRNFKLAGLQKIFKEYGF